MWCRSLWAEDSDRGQTLAEFAIIALVLMLIVLGIFDLGRAVFARNVLANAAREGARVGIITPNDATAIKDAAGEQLAAAFGGDAGDYSEQVRVTDPYSDTDYVRVDVDYVFHPVTFLIAQIVDGGSGVGIDLHAQSTMRVEK